MTQKGGHERLSLNGQDHPLITDGVRISTVTKIACTMYTTYSGSTGLSSLRVSPVESSDLRDPTYRVMSSSDTLPLFLVTSPGFDYRYPSFLIECKYIPDSKKSVNVN